MFIDKLANKVFSELYQNLSLIPGRFLIAGKGESDDHVLVTAVLLTFRK